MIETESIANEFLAAGTEAEGQTSKAAAVPFDAEVAAAEAKVADAAAKVAEGEKTDDLAPEAKPEKTEAERERTRMQRGIDRKTRQLEEARAELRQLRLTREPVERNNEEPQNDSEPLSLTRADVAQLKAQAKAEALADAKGLLLQEAELERRKSVIQSFEAKLGAERFNEVASDLDDAFGGLRDSTGKPKPATDAVFEADDPVKVAEWLSDADNHVEAERISKLSATQAGKAIAKLELRFEAEAKSAGDAKAAEKAKAKPIPSEVPAPLEVVRGQGSVSTSPDPSNTKAWIAWRNAQERKGL